MKTLLSRRGIGTIEYTLVLTLVCAFSLSAILILGESSQAIMASLGYPNSESVANTTITPELESPQTTPLPDASLSSEYPKFHFQIFTSVSSIAMVVFGLMYIRQGRKLQQNKAESASRVDALQKRSLAIEKVLLRRNKVRSIIHDDGPRFQAGEARVEQFMSKEFLTIPASLPIDEAHGFLHSDGFRHLLVADEDNGLLGVVGRKDIAIKPGKTAADVMTEGPKTAAPDLDIRTALSILLQNRITCLPVVDHDRIVGLLTTADLLVLLQCMLVSFQEQSELVQN